MQSSPQGLGTICTGVMRQYYLGSMHPGRGQCALRLHNGLTTDTDDLGSTYAAESETPAGGNLPVVRLVSHNASSHPKS